MEINNNNSNNSSSNNTNNNRGVNQIKSNLLLQQALKTQQLQHNYLDTLQCLVNQYNSAMSQQQTQFDQQTKLIDTLLTDILPQSQLQPQQTETFIPPSNGIMSLPMFPQIILPIQQTNQQTNNNNNTLPPYLSLSIPPDIKNIKNTKIKNENKYYECNGCKKKFADNKDLLKHLNDIDNKKAYKCNKCCKSFARLGNLNNHNRMHDNNSNNSTNSNNSNNSNNNIVVIDKNKNIIMTKSNRTKMNKANNKNIKKPFKCDECNKTFRNKSGLSNHRIIHNGQKPHKCTFGCGKAFARSCDLTRHIRLHTGDKPFKCKFKHCSKSFTRSVQLRLHLMDHTGQRPFKCDICKKGFKTLQNAQIHMRIHTGEKPYVCEHCNKRFTQSSSLKTHLSSIHSQK